MKVLFLQRWIGNKLLLKHVSLEIYIRKARLYSIQVRPPNSKDPLAIFLAFRPFHCYIIVHACH